MNENQPNSNYKDKFPPYRHLSINQNQLTPKNLQLRNQIRTLLQTNQLNSSIKLIDPPVKIQNSQCIKTPPQLID